MALYSIGHSNRSIEDLLAVLQDVGIERVVDIRTFPRSRTNPQFNIEELPGSLAEAGIGYEYFPDLGGRRTDPGSRGPQWHGDLSGEVTGRTDMTGRT